MKKGESPEIEEAKALLVRVRLKHEEDVKSRISKLIKLEGTGPKTAVRILLWDLCGRPSFRTPIQESGISERGIDYLVEVEEEMPVPEEDLKVLENYLEPFVVTPKKVEEAVREAL